MTDLGDLGQAAAGSDVDALLEDLDDDERLPRRGRRRRRTQPRH